MCKISKIYYKFIINLFTFIEPNKYTRAVKKLNP